MSEVVAGSGPGTAVLRRSASWADSNVTPSLTWKSAMLRVSATRTVTLVTEALAGDAIRGLHSIR
jgi:hypothetical protein